jgi:hypothetical protein
VAALRFQLEKTIVIAHHPIVADGAFTLEPENAVSSAARGAPR